MVYISKSRLHMHCAHVEKQGVPSATSIMATPISRSFADGSATDHDSCISCLSRRWADIVLLKCEIISVKYAKCFLGP